MPKVSRVQSLVWAFPSLKVATLLLCPQTLFFMQGTREVTSSSCKTNATGLGLHLHDLT
jgi:hypothetical protein